MTDDSRVEKLVAHYDDPTGRERFSTRIKSMEHAGLLVIVADDSATRERVARAIADQHGGYTGDWQHQTDEADTVLAALAMPRDGAQ